MKCGGWTFYRDANGGMLSYWLASPYVNCGDAAVGYGFMCVNATGSLEGYLLTDSSGSLTATGGSFMPVVLLEPGVQLEWNSTQSRWEFVE